MLLKLPFSRSSILHIHLYAFARINFGSILHVEPRDLDEREQNNASAAVPRKAAPKEQLFSGPFVLGHQLILCTHLCSLVL